MLFCLIHTLIHPERINSSVMAATANPLAYIKGKELDDMSHPCCRAKRLLTQWLAVICFFSTAANVFAQATGRIGGTVVDPTGAIVPGAQTTFG
jgi:hypothetical protein